MSRYRSEAPEGQPTHTPSIRIRGVQTGTAEYQAIVDAHSGALKQFHSAQQDQARLSGQRQYKTTRRLDGVTMTYQNSEGQETITMVVDPVPAGGGEERVSREPWEFALIDFILRQVGAGQVHFAAFLAKPTTPAQKAMTAGTFMPVQGITSHGDVDATKPLLALAHNAPSSADIATVDDDDFYASLRVDLRPFPFQVVEIDIYGCVEPYSETGSPPRDGGEVTTSEFYGVVSLDTPTGTITPAIMFNAPDMELRVDPATASFGQPRLVNCFPELAGLAFSYGSLFAGRAVGVGFVWDSAAHPLAWFSTTASPDNDPSAFMVSGPQTETDTFWGPGILKTSHVQGMSVDYGSGGIATTTVVTPHPDGSNHTVTVTYTRYTAYFIPTVRYASPAPIEVQAVCVRKGDPWTVVSRRENSTANDSSRWEVPATYPTRSPMKLLGDFTIPSGTPDPAEVDFPLQHFGMPKVGTLKIDTEHGSIKFEQA